VKKCRRAGNNNLKSRTAGRVSNRVGEGKTNMEGERKKKYAANELGGENRSNSTWPRNEISSSWTESEHIPQAGNKKEQDS